MFVVLTLVLIYWVAQNANYSDGVSVLSSNQNSFILPGETTRDFSFIDTVKLYNYEIDRYFTDYPWVVKTSLFVVIGSTIVLMVVLFRIFNTYLEQRRKEKQIARFSQKYSDSLEYILASERDLDLEEMLNACNISESYYVTTSQVAEKWFLLYLNKFYGESLGLFRNQNNVVRFFEAIGLINYCQNLLLKGTPERQYRVLQMLRLTRLPISEGALSRVINHSKDYLRKSARQLYMLNNTNNPYNFLKESSDMTLWESMELHTLFMRQHKEGRALPTFLPFIKSAHNSSYESFLIRESAYWTPESVDDKIISYISSESPQVRSSVVDAIAISHYEEGRDILINAYDSATSHEKLRILRCLLYLNPPRTEEFFRKCFMEADAYRLKLKSLYCLYHYGEPGRRIFEDLRSDSSEEQQILFEHVEHDRSFELSKYDINK